MRLGLYPRRWELREISRTFYQSWLSTDISFPYRRYVAFMTEQTKFSLPNSSLTATITGGRNCLTIAADTADVSELGHLAEFLLILRPELLVARYGRSVA